MLYQGKIVAVGTSAEIKNTKDPLVKQFITGFVPRTHSNAGPGVPINMNARDRVGLFLLAAVRRHCNGCRFPRQH